MKEKHGQKLEALVFVPGPGGGLVAEKHPVSPPSQFACKLCNHFVGKSAVVLSQHRWSAHRIPANVQTEEDFGASSLATDETLSLRTPMTSWGNDSAGSNCE